MSKCSCSHQNADQDQKASAYHVYYLVMLLYEVECGFQMIDQYGADDEGDTQPYRVEEEHQHSLKNVSLLGCKDQSRSEKSSDTGRPSDGEDHSEECR